MLTLLLLALALSSDAFAVAIARGVSSTHSWRHAITIGLVFAFFEGTMTIIGWYLGIFAHQAFDEWGRYVVVALLVLMGVKMIRDALKHEDEPMLISRESGPLMALVGLCCSGFAISLDAAACGVALPLLGFSLLYSALIIGGMTLLLSSLGYYAGGRIGQNWGKRAEVVGGIILILLSLKVICI